MKCPPKTLASRLKHQITIQQPTRTSDGMGGFTQVWNTFATVRAAVEPLRGKEQFEHQQIQSSITHRIRIRYRSGITPKMRIQFEGTRYFHIHSVINIEERDREMQLMCEEVADVR